MKIFIRVFARKTITIDAQESNTIETIKSQIHAREGIDPNQQRIIFAGKQMEDSKALSDYVVLNESTLQLAPRLCGGMENRQLQGIEITQENMDIIKNLNVVKKQLTMDQTTEEFMTMNNEALLESAKESKRDDDLNDCARKLWMAASHAIKIVMFECKIAIASRKAVSYCLNMILGSLSDSEQCRHLQSLFLHAIFFDIYSDGALDIEIEEFERRMKNVQNFVNEFSSLSINDVVKEKFNTAIKSFMVFSDDEKTHEIGSYPVRVTTWNGKAIEKNEETKAHGKAKLGGKEYDFDYIFF